MILKNYKNCRLYNDMDLDDFKKWFDIKRDKVVHNIDTLYVTINTDVWDSQAYPLINYLDSLKEQVEFEPVYVDCLDMYINNLTFVNYKYCLEKKDKFMIFFTKKKSTESTPPIFVQIRSQYLWLEGEHNVLKEIYECVNDILTPYNIKPTNVKENRIDYAYHTNYIKDMSRFFNNLNAMQVSKFKRWSKEGTFVGDSETETDYISIGRRTSNNIFIRIYNKSKEVVEQGYKQFFIEYWREQGLINEYDKLIYEQCFERKSYEYAAIARLKFYLTHGTNKSYEAQCMDIINNTKNYEYDDIVVLADLLTPRPTLIINIEFQTKRKFYSSCGDYLDHVKNVTPVPYEPLLYIYRMLDNKILIHRLLTEDVFRLVNADEDKTRKRNKSTSPFWVLIQECKMVNDNMDGKIIRQYQRNLDISAIKKRLVNAMSMFSLYMDNDNNEKDLIEDGLSFLSYLNESDIENALSYKQKKAPALKSKLETTDKVDLENRFALIDKMTGDLIE